MIINSSPKVETLGYMQETKEERKKFTQKTCQYCYQQVYNIVKKRT